MDNKNDIEVKNESGDEGSSGIKGNKYKTRGRKRKRKDSESSTDIDDILPENTLEVEKNLIASAVKNNLDDQSVKKILKKVVTNEHVFALVKLREEEDEDSGVKERGLQPKITRARMKELMKVSPNTNAWNLELTPIKHIPVKTRPEVKALIAQELPEDEDDEEYEPTHDDVPSDDDHTLESCSDIDSQPRTPATPSSIRSGSPRVRQDGPFKVPQELRTPARKRLNLEEEPTIALRTRSKLCLSGTPIEHIESSFIPPDDIPAPDIEDPVWNDFVNDILDPSSVSRVEDDDDADPEYNVAADPDAEEDEEALENTIVNISKKELNDLFTELLDIMPATMTADCVLNEELLIEAGHSVVVWEGKSEPKSDEDIESRTESLPIEKRDSTTRLSVGKTEPHDPDYRDSTETGQHDTVIQEKENIGDKNKPNERDSKNSSENKNSSIRVQVEEGNKNGLLYSLLSKAPAAVRSVQEKQILRNSADSVEIEIDASTVKILPEQIEILQQQLRQHIQLCASNFLQLFVNPAHWRLAPCYKDYLTQLDAMTQNYPNSVVNVCNLKPAVELVDSWEATVSEDTPENKEMVEFIQSEAERSRRRFKQCALYVGEFPELFKRVITNSPVFLYPYLLPAMPYRADRVKKFGYRRCEDNLIALGLDEFWQYVESNPQIYPLRQQHPRARPGLQATCELMCKYMFPWITPRMLLLHVQRVRKEENNPIYNFFKSRRVEPVRHKLLPYNPNITLYEQPEHEVPRIWVRYLAKSSKRFLNHLYKRKNSGLPPVEGVPVEFGDSVEAPKKNPLPIDFTKEIVCTRKNLLPKTHDNLTDKFDINLQTNITNNVVKNLTQNIVVIDNPDATGKIMVLGSLLPVGKVLPSPRKCIDNEVTHNVVSVTNATLNVDDATFTEPNIDNDSETEDDQEVDQVIANNFVSNAVVTEMYTVVETSTGGLLVPMNIKTNTVNSINGPITTVKENISIQKDTNSEVTKTNGNKDHCRCCILLKKICKGKQMSIKDYFTPNNKGQPKPCECTSKTYPKISKRLQMLIENYKMNSWCVFRELKNKINDERREKETKEYEDQTRMDGAYDLDDIAAVVTYQMKVTALTNNYRNYHTKTRVYNLFRNYYDFRDPLYLAEEIYKICDVDLIELYKEFMGFLTVEQAVKIDRFKDYFLQRCVKDIIKKVEQEVSDKDLRHTILSQLDTVIRRTYLKSCEMCCSLLQTMVGLPKLARYVFSLFPHRTVERKEDGNSLEDVIAIEINKAEKQQTLPATSVEMDQQKNCQFTSIIINIQQQSNPEISEEQQTVQQTNEEINTEQQTIQERCEVDTDLQKNTGTPQTTDQVNLKESRQLARELEEELDQTEEELNQTEEELDQTEGALTICEEQQSMDYEADHSSCGEDDNNDTDMESVVEQSTLENTMLGPIIVKLEIQPDEVSESDITTLTVNKTEAMECDTGKSMTVPEEEAVKTEALEWRRDEDKTILEVLTQHLTPQDRKDKTIFDIMEEKNLYQMLAESLTTKSLEDIKERVIYLLEILVLSEY